MKSYTFFILFTLIIKIVTGEVVFSNSLPVETNDAPETTVDRDISPTSPYYKSIFTYDPFITITFPFIFSISNVTIFTPNSAGLFVTVGKNPENPTFLETCPHIKEETVFCAPEEKLMTTFVKLSIRGQARLEIIEVKANGHFILDIIPPTTTTSTTSTTPTSSVLTPHAESDISLEAIVSGSCILIILLAAVGTIWCWRKKTARTSEENEVAKNEVEEKEVAENKGEKKKESIWKGNIRRENNSDDEELEAFNLKELMSDGSASNALDREEKSNTSEIQEEENWTGAGTTITGDLTVSGGGIHVGDQHEVTNTSITNNSININLHPDVKNETIDHLIKSATKSGSRLNIMHSPNKLAELEY